MPKGNYTSNGGWSTKWTGEELDILKKILSCWWSRQNKKITSK